MDPNNPDYTSEDEFDEVPYTIEYDPLELPFMQEECIDTLLPRTDKYKENIVKFQGKLGSIQILKKEDNKDKEREEDIRNDTRPPSYPYIGNIPYINYSEGSLTFMWDKKKGKPKYDQKDNNAWFGPYIIKKKYKKEKYYLTALDKSKMPLPVDGSLLWPFVQGT
jgi:hypothetical protein